MNLIFYGAAAVAIFSALMVITRLNAMHALLYMIVSLLAVALVFFVLGAPFVAALEVIVYAGAIMVMFVFVIMMLNLGPQATAEERQWVHPGVWRGPSILSGILIVELAYVLVRYGSPISSRGAIEPKVVGTALFGPYLIGVELASLLLLAGLVGAYHLGQRHNAGHGKRGES
jgi:NADH-quinone oxidoreductase subunit J